MLIRYLSFELVMIITANIIIIITRSCAALRAADLDWIIGPGYSSGRRGAGGGQGRNKQKRYERGVTTDLLDV